MIWATLNGNLPIVKYLIELKANTEAKDNSGIFFAYCFGVYLATVRNFIRMSQSEENQHFLWINARFAYSQALSFFLNTISYEYDTVNI